MKKLLLVLQFSGIVFISSNAGATKRDVNSAATLASQYGLSSDGDTLNFTANIVVAATFSVAKTIVFQGNGYSISVIKPGLNDAGVRNTSPSAYRVFTLSGSKIMVFNYLTIKGGTVASQGGAVYIPSGTMAKFNFCTISNSENSSGGGAIYNAGNCYLYKSFVTRNIASYGGGMANVGGNIFIEYSTVTENRTATSGGGGGIENNTAGYLYVNNSSFSNNQCGGGAGAINNYGAYTYIFNSSFTGNVSLGAPGGAVYQDNLGNPGRDLTVVNCLFAYNYYTSAGYAASSYTINDVNVVNGNANLYYCIYMTNTSLTYGGAASAGVVNPVIGNTAHLLAANGSTNDIFTGGSYTGVVDGSGQVQGTGKVFQPLLVNISGQRVPTLKSGSYALAKGCNTRFTNGGGTPVFGYKDMGTSTWYNIIGTTTSLQQILDDQTNLVRAATPAAGGIEKTVDNYIILKANYSANGTVNGGSIYGEVYPSGTAITLTAIPNATYAFTNWTKDSSSSVTSSTETGNPFTISPTVNTNLTPNFTFTTNFSITYLGNGNTGGTVPSISSNTAGSTVTTAANTGGLTKTNFTFDAWNTADNGSGTDYTPGVSTYTGSSGNNLTLYAKWGSTGAILILPVNLVSFNAFSINNGKTVQVYWQSAAEINNYYYEVQRSENGQDWETIQRVFSTGNSSILQNYSYTDLQPAANLSFYRLKMVDMNGTTTYSAVRKLLFNGKAKPINIFPNPAINNLFVTAADIKSTGITIYNAAGINVTSSCKISNMNTNQLNIDIAPLPQGVYLLKAGSATNLFMVAGK